MATGYLGNTVADDTGRATFQVSSEAIKVWDVIGRSMIVHCRNQRYTHTHTHTHTHDLHCCTCSRIIVHLPNSHI